MAEDCRGAAYTGTITPPPARPGGEWEACGSSRGGREFSACGARPASNPAFSRCSQTIPRHCAGEVIEPPPPPPPPPPGGCNSTLSREPGLDNSIEASPYWGEDFCRYSSMQDFIDASAILNTEWDGGSKKMYYELTDADVENGFPANRAVLGDDTKYNGGHKFLIAEYPVGYVGSDFSAPQGSWQVEIDGQFPDRSGGAGAPTFNDYWRDNGETGPTSATARMVFEFSANFPLNPAPGWFYNFFHMRALNSTNGGDFTTGQGYILQTLDLVIGAPDRRLYLVCGEQINNGVDIDLGDAAAMLFDGQPHELVMTTTRSTIDARDVDVLITLDGATILEGTLQYSENLPTGIPPGATEPLKLDFYPASAYFNENYGPGNDEPLTEAAYYRVYEMEYWHEGMPTFP